MNHLVTLQDLSFQTLTEILDLALRMKKEPAAYDEVMKRKTLWMLFEKPSLRTRISFETGMTQLGGHAIFYDISSSPLGVGKESVADTVQVVGRYVDLIVARLYAHERIEEMVRYAKVPVINALTNLAHPCQVLADLVTIKEHKGAFRGLKLVFLGDGNNNVTHSLLLGCALTGMDIYVACPEGRAHGPDRDVMAKATTLAQTSGAEIRVEHDARQAVQGADVVYTDSWMSYHIPEEEMNERVKLFTPYQVSTDIMKQAASDAIFMNCLPALRGYEQTAEVIDGPQSVVFDQAENRLHAQKAAMVTLVKNG